MNITHIIRGDDHLINTPRQVLIYNALSYDIPKMAHVSMILGADGKRLSKRQGATSVAAYKELGYLPEAVINFLVRLGWSYGDQEIFSKSELIEKFTLKNVGKSAAVFNEEKLEWLNSWYIKNDPPEKIAELVVPLLKEIGLDVDADKKLVKIIMELRQRAKTLLDITNSIDYFYVEKIKFDENAKNKFLTAEIKPVLEDITSGLGNLNDFNMDEMHGVFDRVMGERELKLGKIAQPVRVALTGGTVSPGIFEVMDILGKDEVLKRLTNAIAVIPED
jgi:glutamyl-tRNA synthetase